MTWEKLLRNYQILIYVAILVLVVSFFFYFFRQASVTQTDLTQLSSSVNQPAAAAGNADIKLNLDLLSSQKFLNLKGVTAATPVYTAGKRNPFVPQ
jgi:hypothetical protein